MTSLLLSLRKFIKILRADVQPRSVALGVGLGFLVGLPPFGVQGVVLLLLFCLLRANLGAFLLSFGIATALAAVLAGPLNALGESLLYAEGLQDFWRSLLNLPVLDAFGLDRFLAMGSTVTALLLAAVGMPLAWRFTDPLRAALDRAMGGGLLARMAARKPVALIGRLLFGKSKDQEAEAPKRWIRRGFLVPSSVLLLSVVLGWALLGDTLARAGMQQIGAAMTGKAVGIEGAKLSLLGGSVDLSEVVVGADVASGRDQLAEGRSFRFDVSMGSLLERRVVIGEATVNDFTWHATAEGAPPTPDEGQGDEGEQTGGGGEDPDEDGGVDLAKVLEWWEAHEEQVRWAAGQVQDFLLKDSPAERGAPGYEGRAHYVYAAKAQPMVQVGKLGVEGLTFDWGEEQGPLTGLRSLDLTVEGLSSSPRIHDQAVSFRGAGGFGPGTLELEGLFDPRGREDSCPMDLGLNLGAERSGALARLGVSEIREVNLQLSLRSGQGEADGLRCQGSFQADNPGRVEFDYTGGAEQRLVATLGGLDPARAGAWARPEAVSVEGGALDLKLELGTLGEALDGSLGIDARNLRLAPGSLQQVLGLKAEVFCQAMNKVSESGGLSLRFELGGTRDAPSLSMDTQAQSELLQQLKTGLAAAGEAALMSQVDEQLGALRSRLDGELSEQLEGRLEGILPGSGELLEGAGKGLLDDAGKDAKEKAGGLIKGLFGGKKKKDDGDR